MPFGGFYTIGSQIALVQLLFAIALATSKSAFLYFKAALILALFMLIQRPFKLKSATHLDISLHRTVPRNYNPQPHKTHDTTLRRFRGDGMDQISQKFAVTDIILANECFSIFFKERGLRVFESRTRRFFIDGAEARLSGKLS